MNKDTEYKWVEQLAQEYLENSEIPNEFIPIDFIDDIVAKLKKIVNSFRIAQDVETIGDQVKRAQGEMERFKKAYSILVNNGNEIGESPEHKWEKHLFQSGLTTLFYRKLVEKIPDLREGTTKENSPDFQSNKMDSKPEGKKPTQNQLALFYFYLRNKYETPFDKGTAENAYKIIGEQNKISPSSFKNRYYRMSSAPNRRNKNRLGDLEIALEMLRGFPEAFDECKDDIKLIKNRKE